MTSLIASTIRRSDHIVRKLRMKAKNAKYRLIGQTNVSKLARLEPRARIDLPRNSTLDCVFSVGPHSTLKDDCYIGPRDGYVSIGSGCSVNRNCVLLGYGGITIGDNVRIAANTSIVAFNHLYMDADTPIIKQGNISSGIVIEDDVWIGSGVRILDGVVLSKGCVIGAGSVVTKSVPPNTVVVGVPARAIKQRVSATANKSR